MIIEIPRGILVKVLTARWNTRDRHGVSQVSSSSIIDENDCGMEEKLLYFTIFSPPVVCATFKRKKENLVLMPTAHTPKTIREQLWL